MTLTMVTEHANMANGHMSVLCVGNYGHFYLREWGSVCNWMIYTYGSRFNLSEIQTLTDARIWWQL
jgi:hypothetical protein